MRGSSSVAAPDTGDPITTRITTGADEPSHRGDGEALFVDADAGVVVVHLFGDVAGERAGDRSVDTRAAREVDERAPEAVDGEATCYPRGLEAGDPGFA